MNTVKKYERAFHTAYLKQQKLPYNKENVELYSSDGELKLLYENENYYIILNKVDEPMFQSNFLNVVNKKTYELEVVDLD